jgi:hypothetical protein
MPRAQIIAATQPAAQVVSVGFMEIGEAVHGRANTFS